jgi:hypothetical protein
MKDGTFVVGVVEIVVVRKGGGREPPTAPAPTIRIRISPSLQQHLLRFQTHFIAEILE